MAKKLKVDLDVDASSVKKKVKDAVSTGGASVTGGGGVDAITPSAERASRSLEKAARNSEQLANGAKRVTTSCQNLTAAFTSLGIGMAVRFARQFTDEGSTTDKVLGYAEAATSSAAEYAAWGARFGPKGAAIAAGIGTVKGIATQYNKNDKEEQERIAANKKIREANEESIKSWEESRKRTLDFKKTLEELSAVETAVTERQTRLKEEIEKREKADAEYGRQLRESIDDTEKLNKLQSRRSENAAHLDALIELQKKLANEKPEANDVRPSFNATDALSRIGGYFGGSQNSDLRTLVRDNQEQLRTLKSIDSKTTKGNGGSWQ